MTYKLSHRSRRRMERLHPDLVRVIEGAIARTSVDFMVLEGVRSKARQAELYAQGRTKPGQKVTWTMNSRHFLQPDGFGHAVDLAPLRNGSIPWNDTAAFDAVARAVMDAAEDAGVPIRWGADWDQDGNPRERGESDSPHFELAPAAAQGDE